MARREPLKATESLVEAAVKLLSARALKGDVKRALAELHAKAAPGDTISARTLETVITAARTRIRESLERDPDELRQDSLAFYNSVVRNLGVATRDRIRAQESIDRLLGLNAPLKHEHSGTVTAAPVDLSKLSDDELAAYRAMLAKMTPAAPP